MFTMEQRWRQETLQARKERGGGGGGGGGGARLDEGRRLEAVIGAAAAADEFRSVVLRLSGQNEFANFVEVLLAESVVVVQLDWFTTCLFHGQ
jgi:hypothetical protein